MNTPSRADIEAALETVMDPCSLSMRSPISIAALGLVEDLRIDGDVVSLSLVLTDPSCIHARDIRRHVRDAVASVPGVGSVDVTFSTTTFWTPQRQRLTR